MMFPRLNDYKCIAIDVEATGLKWYKDEVFGIALSTPVDDYYWDIRTTPKMLDWLYDEMKYYNGIITNHFIKFDLHFLRQTGIDLIDKKLQCTYVRSRLIDETMYENEYSLDNLSMIYLNESKIDPYQELADMFGGKATRREQMKNLHMAPESLVAPYAKKDTHLAMKLWEYQNKEIEKQNLYEICNLEDAVLPVLTRMESRGLKIDIDRAEQNMAKLAKDISMMQKEIDSEIGRPFNINSTPQMRDFFIEKDGKGGYVKLSDRQFKAIDGTIIPSTSKADKNENYNPSLGADTLAQMTHPIAKKVTELRTMIKIHGTFLRDQILGFQEDGYIYANFNQCGTVNGRFSASKPALQAVPKRNKKMSALTRSVFIAEEGEEILRCDFEQSDFRGFVHYTRSAPLVDAYRNDPWTDFHNLVSQILGIPRSPEDVGRGGGANAKQMNLAFIFGMGSGKLAKEMGLPYTEETNSYNNKVWLKPGSEAEEVFYTYHKNIPGVADFNKKSAAIARSRGYVMSVCGRHLRFPNKNLVYKTPGYLYSSFTSDLCKSAMVAVDKIAKIKLQVHDEIIFGIEDRSIVPQVKEAMETALGDKTDIPIRTNPEVGPNWFECKPLEDNNE